MSHEFPLPNFFEATQLHAYHIWETEGCPEGRALDHWLQAERELGAWVALEVATRQIENERLYFLALSAGQRQIAA